jgi:hypothetical protein
MAWLAAALPAAEAAGAVGAASAAAPAAASAGAGAMGAGAAGAMEGAAASGAMGTAAPAAMSAMPTSAMPVADALPAAQPGWFDRLKTGYNGGVGDFIGNVKNFNVPETIGYIGKRNEQGRGQKRLDYYQDIYNKFR